MPICLLKVVFFSCCNLAIKRSLPNWDFNGSDGGRNELGKSEQSELGKSSEYLPELVFLPDSVSKLTQGCSPGRILSPSLMWESFWEQEEQFQQPKSVSISI